MCSRICRLPIFPFRALTVFSAPLNCSYPFDKLRQLQMVGALGVPSPVYADYQADGAWLEWACSMIGYTSLLAKHLPL